MELRTPSSGDKPAVIKLGMPHVSTVLRDMGIEVRPVIEPRFVPYFTCTVRRPLAPIPNRP